MRDNEIVTMTKSTEMVDFFSNQKKTDVWQRKFTNEINVFPMDNTEMNWLIDPAHYSNSYRYLPLLYMDYPFAKDVTPEEIESTRESTKTSIVFPYNDKIVRYPIRSTAFSHMLDRCGGNCRTDSALVERRNFNEISPRLRCRSLNDKYDCYKDKSLILIRDGKVSSILSGDENDYAIMPVIDLVEILESELSTQFKSFEFKSATTCHEVTSIIYALHDNDLEKKILNLLIQNGQLVSKVEVSLQLTTSDVGMCAARISPIIKVDGRVMPIGKPNCVEHKGGKKAMSLFKDIARITLSKYRENVDNITALMKINISDPVGCLEAAVKAINLTGYGIALKEVKDRILQEHTLSCTGYDIYWYLLEMVIIQEEVDKAKGKPINLYSSIKAQESISDLLFIDFNALNY